MRPMTGKPKRMSKVTKKARNKKTSAKHAAHEGESARHIHESRFCGGFVYGKLLMRASEQPLRSYHKTLPARARGSTPGGAVV